MLLETPPLCGNRDPALRGRQQRGLRARGRAAALGLAGPRTQRLHPHPTTLLAARPTERFSPENFLHRRDYFPPM